MWADGVITYPEWPDRSKSSDPLLDDLIKYGYEEDDSWEGILEGVEPDLTASHWPDEDFAPSDIAKRRRGLKRAVIKMLLERIGISVWGVRESLRQLFYP